MLVARVIGHATSSIKHSSFVGTRMVLVQPLHSMMVEPLLVLDRLGTAEGDLVVITSDGMTARAYVNDGTSPARWSVVGIVTDESHAAGVELSGVGEPT